MATSRQFTYGGTGAAPSGTTKTGSLWVGTPTSTERYDLNYGGKIWWMGPDEDNRYIIGKDVPTSDWPAKGDNPPYPHDSGSVRFWGSLDDSEGAFVTRVNTLPARFGQTPFDDGTQCATWLDDNGYWTNWQSQPEGTFFANFRVHDTPTSNDYSENYLTYNPSNDKMFGWNDDMPNGRGNGVFDDISDIAQNSLYIVSESNQYQPTISNSGPGMMCFNGDDGYLNTGTYLVKYNTNNNTVISRVATVNGSSVNNTRRPVFEPSTSKIFIPFGQYVDIFDTSNFSYSSTINLAIVNNNAAQVAIVNTDDDEVLVASKEGFSVFNPSTLSLEGSGTFSGLAGSLLNGVYNSAQGKYYIGCGGTDDKPKVMVIDATTYAVTKLSIAEGGGANNNSSTSIALDTVRNAIWCMNDDRKIAAIDCTDNSITHYNTTFAGTAYSVMPYVINDKLLIGSRVNRNSGKVFKLTTVISNG